jgi:hypothetical protein
MAEHGHARLRSGHLSKLFAKYAADATIRGVAQCVPALDMLTGVVAHPFSNYDDREAVAALPQLADVCRDNIDVIGDLGDQNHVRSPGDPGCQSDLAAVTTHNLEDHDPVVAGCRGLQPVNRLGRHHDCGMIADGPLGGAHVVVYCLGDTDEWDVSLLGEAPEDGETAVTADADQGVEPKESDPFDYFLGSVPEAPVGHRIGERIAAVGRAKYCAGHPSYGGVSCPRVKRRGIDRTLHEAQRAVANADNGPSIALHGAGDDRADHGVEPGAVAAAGQHADRLAGTHAPPPALCPFTTASGVAVR